MRFPWPDADGFPLAAAAKVSKMVSMTTAASKSNDSRNTFLFISKSPYVLGLQLEVSCTLG
jgi:hypothetical protein